MKIEQLHWRNNTGWNLLLNSKRLESAELVLVFGGRHALEEKRRYDEIRDYYPNSNILLCSTAGEILGDEVYDDTITVTAIKFEETKIIVSLTDVNPNLTSYDIGKNISQTFQHENLAHIFLISDGQKVNGSELVRGFNEKLPEGVTVTGGLAGDGSRFQKTLVGLNDYPSEGKICTVAFYGNNLEVSYGSIGGWDSFGPERLITKSNGNILYELDDKPALELYKKYLGELADGLPGNALLFPLSIKLREGGDPVVRTILSIDEEKQCMIFAGDMPEGKYVRLMKANFDRLIDGASEAASISIENSKTKSPDIAILISCIGRKLVLAQRIEEEIEGVREILGKDTVFTGFYSYGEISPFNSSAKCELHNQTMTITTFTER